MSPSQTICLNPPCHPSPTTNIEFFLLPPQTICSNKSMYFTRSVYMSFFEILLRNGPQIRPGSLFYLPQRTICLNKTMAFFFRVGLCSPLYFLLRNRLQCPPCLPLPTTKIEAFMLPNQAICLNPPCHPPPTTNIEFFLLPNQTIDYCAERQLGVYFTRQQQGSCPG